MSHAERASHGGERGASLLHCVCVCVCVQSSLFLVVWACGRLSWVGCVVRASGSFGEAFGLSPPVRGTRVGQKLRREAKGGASFIVPMVVGDVGWFGWAWAGVVEAVSNQCSSASFIQSHR